MAIARIAALIPISILLFFSSGLFTRWVRPPGEAGPDWLSNPYGLPSVLDQPGLADLVGHSHEERRPVGSSRI